jgi:integrin beta 1
MTYSFKNRLSLTNNAEEFRKAVKDTPFGYNFDEPEGGLDALAQVIRCKDEIGWRNESRKIIVFLTDGPYHTAGDGRVAGIFQPYDGQCYMKNNVYAKELEMDYPSVSIINKMSSDEEITVIFVVKSNRQNLYSHLSEAISGSKCITYDGDKIMTLLRDIYEVSCFYIET